MLVLGTEIEAWRHLLLDGVLGVVLQQQGVMWLMVMWPTPLGSWPFNLLHTMPRTSDSRELL